MALLDRWEDQLLGVQAIYMMTAPELDFTSRGALPANVHYVGPAFEPFEQAWHSPWPDTNHDPLVVISFSTSYMNQVALVQRVLDAVEGLQVRALLTAGPALEVDQLRIPSEHARERVRRTPQRVPPRLARRDPRGLADDQRGAGGRRAARLRSRWTRPA